MNYLGNNLKTTDHWADTVSGHQDEWFDKGELKEDDLEYLRNKSELDMLVNKDKEFDFSREQINQDLK